MSHPSKIGLSVKATNLRRCIEQLLSNPKAERIVGLFGEFEKSRKYVFDANMVVSNRGQLALVLGNIVEF